MQAVLDAVVLFGALGVIPAVDGADEVARDAADALEFLRLELVADVDLTVLRGGELQAVDLFLRLSLNIVDVIDDLLLGDIVESIYRDINAVYYHLGSPILLCIESILQSVCLTIPRIVLRLEDLRQLYNMYC